MVVVASMGADSVQAVSVVVGTMAAEEALGEAVAAVVVVNGL